MLLLQLTSGHQLFHRRDQYKVLIQSFWEVLASSPLVTLVQFHKFFFKFSDIFEPTKEKSQTTPRIQHKRTQYLYEPFFSDLLYWKRPIYFSHNSFMAIDCYYILVRASSKLGTLVLSNKSFLISGVLRSNPQNQPQSILSFYPEILTRTTLLKFLTLTDKIFKNHFELFQV